MDVHRQGMSVAEGAAMLLLTSQRPAKPLAVLQGAGLSCDAHHPTAPHPQGHGARAAMLAALEDAGLTPAAIGYINLHGTGTPDNDLAEARAIVSLFPTPPPLSSTKGATGHTLGAAGIVEALILALAIQHRLAPGGLNTREIDPALKSRYLLANLETRLDIGLSNSFGFGGANCALVLGRADRLPKARVVH